MGHPGISGHPAVEGGWLAAARNHLAGVLQAGVGDFGAAQHARHFVGTGAVVEQTHLHFGAAVGFALVDEEMLIGECGNLRQWVTQRTCCPC